MKTKCVPRATRAPDGRLRRWMIGLLLTGIVPLAVVAQPAPAPAEPVAVVPDTPDAAPTVTPPPYAGKRYLVQPTVSPDDDPSIPNYFLHIVSILETEGKKPIPEPRAPGARKLEPRSYPFDSFEAFRSRDMMRAIKEGVRDARDNGFGKTEAQIQRQIEANILLVLQYYPIAAADRDGFLNLWYAMEDPNGQPILRRILYTLAAPKNYEVSQFSQYLQDHMRNDRPKMLDLYAKVILSELERSEIRHLALDNLYTMRVEEIELLLGKDANAAAFIAANNRPPGPKDLMDPPAFTPSRASKVAIERCRKDLDATAAVIGELITPKTSATAALRKAARDMLVRMRNELPLHDPAQVDAMLEASMNMPIATEPPTAPEAPAAPESPSAPPAEEVLAF